MEISNNNDLNPVEVSFSREKEMKEAHDSQQQFHSLLKEYMGKFEQLFFRENPEKKSIPNISVSMHAFVIPHFYV